MSELFVLGALLALLGAVGVLVTRLPVHGVVAMVVHFVGLAVLYLSLHAEYLAVLQIIIYAGAMMVMFLFVIALLTAKKDPLEAPGGGLVRGQNLWGTLVAGLLFVALLTSLRAGILPGWGALVEEFGSVKNFGAALLTTHLLPFELTAVILLVAVIGVIILVGRHEEGRQ